MNDLKGIKIGGLGAFIRFLSVMTGFHGGEEISFLHRVFEVK